MRIARALATVSFLALVAPGAASARTVAQTDLDQNGYKLYGIPLAPDRSSSAVSLRFVTPGAGLLKATGLDGTIANAVAGTDYEPGLTFNAPLSRVINTVSVAANGIGNAQLRQGAATSVVGNPTGSTANLTDITCGADGQYIGRSGGTLSCQGIGLTATAIGYGSGSNTLTGDAANLSWISGTLRAGIRTGTPEFELHLVDAAAAADRGLTIGTHNASVTGAADRLRKSRGTFGSPAAVTAGDYVGTTFFQPYSGTSYLSSLQVGGHVKTGATITTTSTPTDWYVFPTPAGTNVDPWATSSTLALRVDGSTGNLGIQLPPTFALNGTLNYNGTVVGTGVTTSHTITTLVESQVASRGTITSPTAVSASDLLWTKRWSGHDGTNYITAMHMDVYAQSVATGDVRGTWTLSPSLSGSLGNTQVLYADSSYNVTLGKIDTLATSATDGFPYLPGTLGPPTGVPTFSALLGPGFHPYPIDIDATNDRIYVYEAGWKPMGQYVPCGGSSCIVMTNASGIQSAAASLPGSSVSLTSTQLGFGSGSNTMTSNARFRVTDTTNGVMQIGATLPDATGGGISARLRVSYSDADGGYYGIANSYHSNNTFPSQMFFAKSRGTSTSPTPVVAGDYLGFIDFYGYTGATGQMTGGFKMGTIADPAFTVSDNVLHERWFLAFGPNGGVGVDPYGSSRVMLSVDSAGSLIMDRDVATNATRGFLYMNSMSLAPTTTPQAYNGNVSVPMIWHRGTDRLYAYVPTGAAWRTIAQWDGGAGSGFVRTDNSGFHSVDSTTYVPTARTLTPDIGILIDGGASPLDMSANRTIGARIDNTSITSTVGGALQRGALSGGDVTAGAGSGVLTIVANAVTDAKFRQGAATSVVGRSANSTGNVADIACSADGNVVWRNGTTLGCTALDYSKLTGSPTLYYQTIQSAGVDVTLQRPKWNAHTGLSASDNSGSARTDVTVNLSVGIAGGQSVIGGNGAGQNLTLSSTSNVSKGQLRLGSSSYFFDEAAGVFVLGTTAPLSGAPLEVSKNQNNTSYSLFVNPSTGGNAAAAIFAATRDDLSGSFMGTYQYGSNYTTSGLQAANVGEIVHGGGTANMLISQAQAAGDIVFTTGTGRTERARIASGGNFSVPNLGTAMVKAVAGVLTPAVAGTDFETPITAGTGLTDSANVFSVNLSTGISGGQSAIGGTAAGNALTLSSTSNATKGPIRFGSSLYYFDEPTNALVLGTASPLTGSPFAVSKSQNATSISIFSNPNTGGNAATAVIAANRDDASVSYTGFYQFGSGYTTSGLLGANVGWLLHSGGSANFVISQHQAAGDIVFTTGTGDVEKARLINAGTFQVSNLAGSGNRVMAASATGGLGIATAGVDYQAQHSVPAEYILYSAGTSSPPTGQIGFAYDTGSDAVSLNNSTALHVYNLGSRTASANFERLAIHNSGGVYLFKSEAQGTGVVRPILVSSTAGVTADSYLQVNGVAASANDAFVVGHTTNGNRDHVRFFVGGGAAPDTTSNSFVDVIPSGTTITTANNGGTLATVRLRTLLYTGSGGPSIPEVSTLLVDGAPSCSGIGTCNPTAIHVKAGQSLFDGHVTLNNSATLGGSGGQVAFFGAGVVAQQTVTGASDHAALCSLITALANNYNLVVNGTAVCP